MTSLTHLLLPNFNQMKKTPMLCISAYTHGCEQKFQRKNKHGVTLKQGDA